MSSEKLLEIIGGIVVILFGIGALVGGIFLVIDEAYWGIGLFVLFLALAFIGTIQIIGAFAPKKKIKEVQREIKKEKEESKQLKKVVKKPNNAYTGKNNNYNKKLSMYNSRKK